MKYINRFSSVVPKILLTIILVFPLGLLDQKNKSPIEARDTLMATAKEIMVAARYCALITLNESGHPNVRTMDPFSPEEDFVVWFGTNSNSRKVNEIRKNPKTTLYYQSPNGGGYVVIKGHASIVDDPQIKRKYWKDEWESFYSDKDTNYILIKIVPDILEIVDYPHGIIGDSKTWAVPCIEF